MARPRFLPQLAAASLCLWLCLPVGLGEESDRPQVSPLEEIRALFADVGSRAPGTSGNRALEQLVADRFGKSDLPNGQITFHTPVFRPGNAAVTFPDGTSFQLEAMHPTLMRPGNFRDRDFETRLVYLGRGDFEDLERLKGTPLDGAIAVTEYDCGARWTRFLRFGVRGFVFVGASEYHHRDSVGKVYNTEVAVPRFFVPAEEGAGLVARCREKEPPSVRVTSSPSRWESARLRDLWAMIPGTDEMLAKDIVVFVAALDANSVVPSRATGGQSAGNLALLLKLFEDFSKSPPARTVILAAVNARTQKFLGHRMLAWYLLTPNWRVERLRNQLAQDMRIARLYSSSYGRLKLGPCEVGPVELHVMMEVLWQLDEEQQQQRQEAREAALKARLEEIERRQATGESTEDLAANPIPPVDEILDLSPFEMADYVGAIDAAVAKFKEERTNVRSWVSSDRQARKDLAEDERRVESLKERSLEDLRSLAEQCKTVFDDEKLLESWRAKRDSSTGVQLPIKGPLQEEAKRQLNMCKLEMMEVSASEELTTQEIEAQLEELQARREEFSKVLVLFNKIDIGMGRSRTYYRQIAGNEGQRTVLEGYRDLLIEKYSRWYDLKHELLRHDSANDGIRDVLPPREVKLVIDLDLDWRGDRVGFLSIDPFARNAWQRRFGRTSVEIAEQVSASLDAAERPFVDTMTNVGGKPEQYHFHTTESAVPYYHCANKTPALALRTVQGSHGSVFSPVDSLEPLDEHNVALLQTWLRDYFRALLSHPEITSKAKLPQVNVGWNSLWVTTLRTYRVDEFSAKITPSLEVPGCLVAAYPAEKYVLSPIVAGDVVNCYTAIGDETGQAILYALCESANLAPLAYEMDEDFLEVIHTIDKGRIQSSKQVKSTFGKERSKTLPMFPCREFPVYDRVDPSLVSAWPITVQKLWPMSAKSRAEPQKYGVHGIGSLSAAVSHQSTGPAAVYLWRKDRKGFEQDRLILLTDGRRLAANPTEEEPEGIGYETAEALGSDFFLRVAADMDLVNRHRIGAMRGVSNELLTGFLGDGRQAIEESERVRLANDHNAALLANYRALGNEVKAYGQTRGITNDMLKAILVYMALMVPFCFFLQKLLFQLDRLEQQILAFVLLFVGTYIVFRFIHPAFAIAMNPEAIFIAFLLGTVGCFVTWVLHSKFEAEMQLIFRSHTGSEADVGYVSTGQTAMMIGVSNMKRRRVRTVLTTGTIVLVVFTMLAFSSVSKKMMPTIIPKGGHARYTGFFYHWPGGKPMDEPTRQVLVDLFAGRAKVLVRRMMEPASAGRSGTPWRLEIVGDRERSLDVKGIVGWPVGEDRHLGQLPLIQGRNFSSPDAPEVILTATAAEALGLSAQHAGTVRVRILGRELTVVGFLEDERYLLMRDLNPDFPLLPRRAKGYGQSAADAEAEEAAGVLTIDTSSLILLPDRLSEKMGAGPFTVSVCFPESSDGSSSTDIWQELELLLRVTRAKIYLGSTEPFGPDREQGHTIGSGVYYVGSGYRTSIGGVSRLVIPLLIAGCIVLNTMLGTVYERKSEIAIYNAIGMNPTHIFIFFLAEAFVYSFIGSVGGYLIGQVLAMLLKASGLVQGVNINFSSLIVVYTILFTIGLVLLSTVYPGFVATRTAVPSGKRRWSLPGHDGQRMEVAFPFIYQPRLVPGVMCYLRDFFSRFTEKSFGELIARDEELQAGTDGAGRPTYSLSYAISLAPFDLGVTQRVLFYAHYDEAVSSYRLHTTITRVSGQDTSWATTNKPFLEKLRRLLMRWRNLDTTAHSRYSQSGEELFETRAQEEATV